MEYVSSGPLFFFYTLAVFKCRLPRSVKIERKGTVPLYPLSPLNLLSTPLLPSSKVRVDSTWFQFLTRALISCSAFFLKPVDSCTHIHACLVSLTFLYPDCLETKAPNNKKVLEWVKHMCNMLQRFTLWSVRAWFVNQCVDDFSI